MANWWQKLRRNLTTEVRLSDESIDLLAIALTGKLATPDAPGYKPNPYLMWFTSQGCQQIEAAMSRALAAQHAEDRGRYGK